VAPLGQKRVDWKNLRRYVSVMTTVGEGSGVAVNQARQ